MTRYKKYLKSIGIKFSEDYPYLPFDNYGTFHVLEGRQPFIIDNQLIIRASYNVGDETQRVNKDGSIETLWLE